MAGSCRLAADRSSQRYAGAPVTRSVPCLFGCVCPLRTTWRWPCVPWFDGGRHLWTMPGENPALTLPLIHHFTVDRWASETALERVLPVGAFPRIAGDPLPRDTSVAWCCGAHPLPALGRFARSIPEVPPAFGRRRAIRSRRFGTSQPSGATTGSPRASSARRSRRASFGSAWTSAVARHSPTRWLRES